MAARPSPALWWVCILNGHAWKLHARYSWSLGLSILNGQRCSRCDARRPLPLRDEFARVR